MFVAYSEKTKGQHKWDIAITCARKPTESMHSVRKSYTKKIEKVVGAQCVSNQRIY